MTEEQQQARCSKCGNLLERHKIEHVLTSRGPLTGTSTKRFCCLECLRLFETTVPERAKTSGSSWADTKGLSGSSILTASGLYFDYQNPRADKIRLTDIAKAIGNTCRFAGHCKFYSVAEHSIHCATLATLNGSSREICKHVLMHDAAEAYVGDMPTPLKKMMPDFQELEGKVQDVINLKFGMTDEFKDQVRHFDLCMLKVEKNELFPRDNVEWPELCELPDHDIKLQMWSPKQSAKRFLRMTLALNVIRAK